MVLEKVETLVVGGGQAGVATSEHLSRLGISHVVLERGRIAERWRSERWDSLVANGPAWHDRFPGLEFPNVSPDAFVSKEAVADYFALYAAKFNAPVRCGVDVVDVRKKTGETGFIVTTTDGTYDAENVVAATGPFQKPVIPPIIPSHAPVTQMHSNAYMNPAQLAKGAVLVIGAGSSGAQIAQELMEAGRKVYLSVGPHDRPPRSYRGRDFVWWLGVLGKWDASKLEPGREHVTIAVSGAHGGKTIDFRDLASRGMTLLGMTETYADGALTFRDDLATNIAEGDANYLSVLDEADAYVIRNGLDLPEEPAARKRLDDPTCLTDPLRKLDLKDTGISTVIWATGYALDYSWLKVDAFDAAGKPDHQRGISTEPGVYFVGLPWQSRRGSSFIWGVWHDAKYVADHIVTRRIYSEHYKRGQPNAAGRIQTTAGTGPTFVSSGPVRLSDAAKHSDIVVSKPSPAPTETEMAHTRIRTFNTKETYPEQKLDNDLCQAVVTQGGKTVWLRGQCPQNLDDAKNIDSHDPVAQTHKVMQNIKQLIEEAGGTIEHLVKVVVYITDVRHREAVYRTMGEYIKGVHPVSTGLVVQALARPDWLVEIDGTAVIPDDYKG